MVRIRAWLSEREGEGSRRGRTAARRIWTRVVGVSGSDILAIPDAGVVARGGMHGGPVVHPLHRRADLDRWRGWREGKVDHADGLHWSAWGRIAAGAHRARAAARAGGEYEGGYEEPNVQLHGSLRGRGSLSVPASRPQFPCRDRKSTRLNSSHLGISYAVFCLKKKK